MQVTSITREGAVTKLGAPFARSVMSQGSIAVDEDATTWVPHWFVFSQPDSWGVVLVTASGQVTELVGPAGPDPTAVNGMRTPERRALRLASGTADRPGDKQWDEGNSETPGCAGLQELVAAVGYPQGTYRGPLAFSGESPDPAAACAAGGQPVTYPLGPAVTLFAPGLATITGVREVGGAALAGCVLGAVFLPENPLVAGRGYEASGSWDLGEGAPDRDVELHGEAGRARRRRAGPCAAAVRVPVPAYHAAGAARRHAAAAQHDLDVAAALSRRRPRVEHRHPRLEPGRLHAVRAGDGALRGRAPRRGAARRRALRGGHAPNRRASRCTRYVRVGGAFSFSAESGRNALRFSGRVSGRRLSAGRYRLRAVATDAARNGSSPRHSRVFTIVRR